jgi:hypothetical protein
MNFLAHGLFHLDSPWTLTGTALPDWLRLLHRKARVRLDEVRAVAESEDGPRGRLARGLLAHHEDDRRFHQSQAFHGATRYLTDRIRQENASRLKIRPSFVSHILLEMLLDAALMAEDPSRVDRYYASLAEVPPREVWEHVQAWVPAGIAHGHQVSMLPRVMERFLGAAFLHDYHHDEDLLFRLDQVMGRLGLDSPAPVLRPLLSHFREEVANRAEALIAGGQEEPVST